MAVERMGYIVYYKGSRVLQVLEKLPVNITYTSDKLNYTIFYSDKNQFKLILNTLRKVKGFLKLEEQPIFDEKLNFDVK